MHTSRYPTLRTNTEKMTEANSRSTTTVLPVYLAYRNGEGREEASWQLRQNQRFKNQVSHFPIIISTLQLRCNVQNGTKDYKV